MSKTRKYEVLTFLKKYSLRIPYKIADYFITPKVHQSRWRKTICNSEFCGISGSNSDNPQLIVSLTTFPARIKYVHIPIESMLMQTVKPDMVILWLADSQFPNREEDLPDELLELKKYGLTIDWCDDIRSYKKLVPTLEKYPDAAVVTIDDDLSYSPKLIEKLINGTMIHGNTICCHRAHRIEKSYENSNCLFLRKEVWFPYTHPSFLNQLTSGAGTYFPAHSLHLDVTDKELFIKLAPTNDDIWFWLMAVLAGVRCYVVKGHECRLRHIPETMKGEMLSNYNNTGRLPVYEQMMNILNYYPQLKEILNNEWDKEQKGGFA